MKLPALYRRLGPLLRPLSLPYSLFMAKRRSLYESGVLPRFSPACPCVAVGNISWGGTGKTPFVSWLLDWAEEHSVRAVVLTRGYGGNPGKTPLVVAQNTPPENAGDEPLLLARCHPQSRVVVFPRRSVSGRFAEETLRPELFVLDDGMQHLAVRRDADIVLLRPQDLKEEWNAVIPAGSWRENKSALSRAAAFAVKARPEDFARLAPLAQKHLGEFGIPLFSFTLAPKGLRPLFHKAGGDALPMADTPAACTRAIFLPADTPYRNAPYILISGVGDPAQVENDVTAFMGRPPVQHFDFEDHHPYTPVDVQAVLSLSAAPLPIVCTAKDAVKLERFAPLLANHPVLVLETEVRFGPALFSSTDFPQWWKEWWTRASHASSQSA